MAESVGVAYSLLRAEPWWGLEHEPPNLLRLLRELRAHFNASASMIGAKGDNRHLSGFHRSRAWVLNSRYSKRGAADYSVAGALNQGGDPNWLCALDLQTNGGVPELVRICQRLDRAVQADELPAVREWYGNLGGDQVVDGWNAVLDRAASSDSSHLWHLHVSFFRSRANDDHSHLLAVLIGDEMSTADVVAGLKTPLGWVSNAQAQRMAAAGWPTDGMSEAAMMAYVFESTRRLDTLAGLVEAIAAKVDIDAGELAAIREASAAGTREAVVASADALAVAVAARLPNLVGLTSADVAAAVREVLLQGVAPDATP